MNKFDNGRPLVVERTPRTKTQPRCGGVYIVKEVCITNVIHTNNVISQCFITKLLIPGPTKKIDPQDQIHTNSGSLPNMF